MVLVSIKIYTTLLYLFPSENEKNIVDRNVSTSGVSIYFEAYLYDAPSYTNTQWQFPPTHLSSSQRRPSTATEDEEEDSPSESQTTEKVKKPKKVYCYVSPKVDITKRPLLSAQQLKSFLVPYILAPDLGASDLVKKGLLKTRQQIRNSWLRIMLKCSLKF